MNTSCQTFFYLTRICSGGKVRMRAERQNCDSNFSRLARQRRLPAVAARLFLFNIFIYVAGRFCFTSGAKPCITASSLYSINELIRILFLNCDSGFAFLFWREVPFFSKQEDCLKKTALVDFFEDSYWQAGALYVLYDFFLNIYYHL